MFKDAAARARTDKSHVDMMSEIGSPLHTANYCMEARQIPWFSDEFEVGQGVTGNLVFYHLVSISTFSGLYTRSIFVASRAN